MMCGGPTTNQVRLIVPGVFYARTVFSNPFFTPSILVQTCFCYCTKFCKLKTIKIVPDYELDYNFSIQAFATTQRTVNPYYAVFSH